MDWKKAVSLLITAMIVVLITLVWLFARQCSIKTGDISPNSKNGTMEAKLSKAGVVCELAGSEALLYAVSLNAGVWRSENAGKWIQLANSPRYASVIAVDPNDPAHVAVGERAGEAMPELNRTGVWESFDRGDTWKLIFNPASQSRDILKQAVNDVEYTPQGTLLIGTSFGIGRKASTDACPESSVDCFDFGFTPADVSEVTAFSFSRSSGADSHLITWALGYSQNTGKFGKILFSDDDGLTWGTDSVPDLVDALPVNWERGDRFTLAAYDDIAIMSARPPETSRTSVNYCSNPTLSDSNWVSLLYYSRSTGDFFFQLLDSPYQGDGRGMGGRARLKVFSSDNSYEPSVGNGLQIYYAFGQDMIKATRIAGGAGRKGELDWTNICRTCGGLDNRITINSSCYREPDSVHVDIWDVHYDPSANGSLRVAGDGGVYKRVQTLKGEIEWVTHNDGLHTHHIHSVITIPSQDFWLPVPQLAYTTMDNDTWYRGKSLAGPMGSGWHGLTFFGDADFTAGDPAVEDIALIGGRGFMKYTDFGHALPYQVGKNPGDGILNDICNPPQNIDECKVTPLDFQVIQTLKDETDNPLLDVVMLVRAPVLKNGVWTISQTGGPLLIRNKHFLADPDVLQPGYDGWEVVSNDLPANTRALWVSNGHTHPVYYIEAIEMRGPEIYRWDDTNNTWQKLVGIGSTILDTANSFWTGSNIGYGPLFVNPFNPDQVYILTIRGVVYSTTAPTITGSMNFIVDADLTALVSQSNTYDFASCYGGGPFPLGSYESNRATARYILAHMAFDKEKPDNILVGSPVSGLFYSQGKAMWQNLTEFLPQPLSMISSVSLDGHTGYAALEGRGLWRIADCREGKYATYFESTNSAADPAAVAILFGTGRNLLAGLPVQVRVVDGAIETVSDAITDQAGIIRIGHGPGDVIHIHFAGNDKYAASKVSLVH